MLLIIKTKKFLIATKLPTLSNENHFNKMYEEYKVNRDTLYFTNRFHHVEKFLHL